MWRSAGFLVSLAALLDLVTLVAFAITILGGRQKRQSGWPVLCGLLFLVAGTQCAAMAIVVCVQCLEYDGTGLIVNLGISL